MNGRQQIQEAHEGAVIGAFIQWMIAHGQPRYELIDRPNPPDGILRAGSRYIWVEIGDIYRSGDEAHEERSHVTPGETRFIHREHPILAPDERTADAALQLITNKLSNQSYREAFERYGPGILICCERDPLVDETTMQEILDVLEGYWEELENLNAGVFCDIYIYERPNIFHKIHEFGSEAAL